MKTVTVKRIEPPHVVHEFSLALGSRSLSYRVLSNLALEGKLKVRRGPRGKVYYSLDQE